MRRKILIVEDDAKTAELIRLYLEKDGYAAQVALDGERGLQLARAQRPDLIVLDVMLPKLDGLEFCRLVRAEAPHKPPPIVMLTARSTEEDKLSGLDLGADDYVTKPFSPRELLARVRAVLRRAADDAPPAFTCGDLTVNFRNREAHLRGGRLHLTAKEFSLLEVLMRAPGRAFSRLELVERAFGLGYEGLERTVDMHILNLRRKLGDGADAPHYIQTVYGVGYKFREMNDVA